MTQIPAFNLQRAIEPIADQVEDRWRSLLKASAFVGGAAGFYSLYYHMVIEPRERESGPE